MERVSTSSCIQQKYADRVCAQENCKYPALMCANTNCWSCKNHSKCNKFIITDDLLKKLMKKGYRALETIDPFQQFYENQMKHLLRHKQEYLKTRKQPGFALTDNQQKLYKMLTEGPAIEIYPQMVANVDRSLNSKYQKETIKQYQNLQKFVNETNIKLQDILQKAKKKWIVKKDPPSNQHLQIQKAEKKQLRESGVLGFFKNMLGLSSYQSFDCRFSSCESEITQNIQVSQYGKKIRVSRKTNSNHFSSFYNNHNSLNYALTKQSVQSDESCKKIRFLINKSRGSIYIGLAFVNMLTNKRVGLKKSTPRRSPLQQGAYLLGNNNSVISYKNQIWAFQQKAFGFSQGNIITLNIDIASSKMTIVGQNKGQQKQITFYINRIQGDKLHPCVLMDSEGDGVQIL